MSAHARCLLISLSMVAAALFGLPADVLSAQFGVLSSIDVKPTAEAVEIHIQLNLPLRYQSHAPQRGGDFVEIQLRPVSTAEIKVLQQRQSLPWRSSEEIPLVDVVYEGNFPGTPTVVLNFSHAVEFQVRGGRDLRSIIVTLPRVEPESERISKDSTRIARAAAPATVRASPSASASIPAKSAAPAPAGGRAVPPFTINLYSAIGPIDLHKVRPLPEFDGLQLYKTQAVVKGKLWNRLRLGFFADVESARKMLEALKGSYPQAWVARASTEERLQFGGPATPPAAIASGQPSAATPPQSAGRALTADQQRALMEEARSVMTAGDYPRAIQIYTKILLLPPGQFSQQAQELLGLARERNGQIAHAKAEYEEYLRLYPGGPDAERVQQRLAGLLTASTRPQEKLRPVRSGDAESNWDVFGSFTQFYRRDTFDTDASGETTTQSSLFSDLNVAARNRGDDYDFRAQFTGGYDWDLLDSSDSRSRVSELYVDALARNLNLSARIGRQTRSSGGVLGRFDGALLGYRLTPNVVGNVVLGYPVARTSDTAIETNKYFYGLSFDLGTYFEHWDFNTYIIEQKADGLTDRRAVGGELRYFDSQRSFFSLVDYDLFFKKLNTVLGVGTWNFANGTNINANLDYRKSPILTSNNAIQGQGVFTLEELRALFTDDEIKQLALDRTAESTTGTLGASHPLSPRFQISGDVTVTKLSGTKASGGVPATPGTGYELLYNLQLTGSSLLTTGDLGIVGLRYADLDASDLYTLSLNTRYPITSTFRINPRFDAIFRRNKNDGGKRTTLRPFLRLEYQWKRNTRFESEIGGDWIEDDNSFGSETIRTYFVNIGYRLDF